MPLSGEEIRRRLGEFVEHWRGYQGTERAEAQTFLNQLAALHDGILRNVPMAEPRGSAARGDRRDRPPVDRTARRNLP